MSRNQIEAGRGNGLLQDSSAEAGLESRLAEFGLSDKETLAVTYMVAGLTSAQSAKKMGVQPSTVRAYLQRAYKKAGVVDSGELKELLLEPDVENDRASALGEGSQSHSEGARKAKGMLDDATSLDVELADAKRSRLRLHRVGSSSLDAMKVVLLFASVLLLLPSGAQQERWDVGWELVCGAASAVALFALGICCAGLWKSRGGAIAGTGSAGGKSDAAAHFCRCDADSLEGSRSLCRLVIALGFATALLVIGAGACLNRFVVEGLGGGAFDSLLLFGTTFFVVLCLSIWRWLLWGCARDGYREKGFSARILVVASAVCLAYVALRPWVSSVAWMVLVVMAACAVMVLGAALAPRIADFLSLREGGEDHSEPLFVGGGHHVPYLLCVGVAWGLAWEELWRSLSTFSVLDLFTPFMIGALVALTIFFLSTTKMSWKTGLATVALAACAVAAMRGSSLAVFVVASAYLLFLLEGGVSFGILSLGEAWWGTAGWAVGCFAGFFGMNAVRDAFFLEGLIYGGVLNPFWATLSFALGALLVVSFSALCLLCASLRNGRRMAALLDEGRAQASDKRMRAFLDGRGLNSTQVEVAMLIARGATSAQISEMLNYSRGTINTSRAVAYRLLGVHSRTQLVDLLERESAI